MAARPNPRKSVSNPWSKNVPITPRNPMKKLWWKEYEETKKRVCHNPWHTLFTLPPFERAVRCIKYYEGWHDIKRNYPYIGWGHRILPHEKFRKNLTFQQADSLLRSDLRKLCALFRKYGRDTLLLAVLAYNVGPYKILGNGKFPKSRLLQKIEQGERNIRREYLDFCRYQRRKIASIHRRRQTELLLLYKP